MTSDYCVKNTIRDAYVRDYDIIVLRDCIASMSKEIDRVTLSNV